MPEDLLKSKKKTSKKPDRADGKVLNSNKYIELRPTMEEFIKNLCETIMDIDEMIISENEKVDTIELIASVLDEAYDDFYNDLPDSLKEHAEVMFSTLTEFVDNIEGYNTISESKVMDLAQRRKKAMVIRRHKAKILTAKRRAARRRADSGTIERRANRKARLYLKKRFTGKKSYNAMSPSEKLAVDKRMERMPKSVLQRLTTKMIPKVKQAETERLRKANKNNGDDKNKTTKSVAKQDVTKKTTRKVGEIKQDTKKKTVKENIELMENMTNINAIFESEYITKSELPKKIETCGVKRVDMPQVSQSDHVYLKRYLTREKIGYKMYHADPESFEPTQSEFNIDKVNKIIDDIDDVKDMVILVSRDNKVIDGHHRWLAFKKTGTRIKVLKINKRYDNVLDILTEFPKTFNKGVNENKEV